MMLRSVVLLSVIGSLLPVMTAAAFAGDWPQILGPNRNGQAAAERLLERWPASGPAVLWRYPLGSGYAGAAAVGERVIVFHRVGAQERVESLAAGTGKSQWKADFPARYRGGVNLDQGPRCVPLVRGDSVYAFGAAGDLYAVALASGQPLWTRGLYADLGGDEGYFGAGSTPIFVGGKLLVNVGGRNAGLAALDPATGRTVWQASDEAASYSSPTAVPIQRAEQSEEQAVFITRMNCVLVDPASGQTTTLFAFGKRGPTVNAAAPLFFGGKLFATSSYGVGATCATLDRGAATKLWANDETLSSQYSTPVEQQGFLYGNHGREDIGVAELRCVEAATGKVRWSQPGFGVAHAILADGKLLLQTADGRVLLVAADPAHYRELASARITGTPTRALPALAAGRLFVRTGEGGGELVCLRVGP
jgi:outer membrane protein assembly factor BamB